MLIRVYGPGCNRCEKALAAMEEALLQAGAEGQVEKVSDVQEMIKAAVLATPVVEINGSVVCRGRAPSVSEAVTWIMSALAQEE
jgi:small redox-active disulfide protein 2